MNFLASFGAFILACLGAISLFGMDHTRERYQKHAYACGIFFIFAALAFRQVDEGAFAFVWASLFGIPAIILFVFLVKNG
jgi:hypothetical protein